MTSLLEHELDLLSDPAGPTTLGSLLDRTVARYGDLEAVVDDTGRHLTWSEVGAAADTLALRLLAAGVDREDRVAVLRRRTVDLVVSVLGIVRAGAVYVTVDDRYPRARREEMITRSGARLVVVDPDHHEPLPCEKLAFRAGDDVQRGVLPVLDPTDAACVLFTSGSTGTPKGVVLEHRNLLAWATNRALPALRPDDRVAQVANVSFDAFHYELWCALAAGSTVVVMPSLPDLARGDIGRELRRRRISAMLAPTLAVNHVVQEDQDAFATLRVLHTGGDVISPSACRDILSGRFEGTLWNLYGPTEGTTACTGFEVTVAATDAGSVPIGHALDGVQVHVLDERLRPVPASGTGQLYIGGVGVARGYLHDPVRTAERFLPDPFAADGSTMYATGDLVLRRPDGALEFRGRADRQVKIRGYRVEPAEVEQQLAAHPGVRDVAVVVLGDHGDKRLVAVVVPIEELAPGKLRTFAAQRMPDYQVPADLLVVAEIPSTTHGKRDQQALLALVESSGRQRSPYAAPQGGTERWLAQVWESLLGLERIGADDDFFRLGGHSMLAFRVRRQIRSQLGVTIALQDVLENSVLRDLAAAVDAAATDVAEVAP